LKKYNNTLRSFARNFITRKFLPIDLLMAKIYAVNKFESENRKEIFS